MDRQIYTDWTRRAGCALIGFVLAAGPAAATPSELVVLVDTGTQMPMARFDDGRLVEGFHKDVGDALARKMGREARFLPLPRKRIVMALDAGQADLICLYLPPWLPGRFLWTRSFFPASEVVVTDTSVPQPHHLTDLSGQPVATVLGYYYPELESVLGNGFIRDDGFSSSANLRKMSIGRLHHVVTQQSTLDYYLQTGHKLSVYPPLMVLDYMAQCAVSPRGQVSLEEVNKAITQISRDGTVAKIIDRYRPPAK